MHFSAKAVYGSHAVVLLECSQGTPPYFAALRRDMAFWASSPAFDSAPDEVPLTRGRSLPSANTSHCQIALRPAPPRGRTLKVKSVFLSCCVMAPLSHSQTQSATLSAVMKDALHSRENDQISVLTMSNSCACNARPMFCKDNFAELQSNLIVMPAVLRSIKGWVSI